MLVQIFLQFVTWEQFCVFVAEGQKKNLSNDTKSSQKNEKDHHYVKKEWVYYGMCPFKAGVSNSNWSEGHILEIKCFVGRSLPEKSFCGPQYSWKALKIR